jgi:ribonuclease H / adenosylcobalamin/alpha-ribazole phosphatase
MAGPGGSLPSAPPVALIVEADGASRGNPGNAAYGALVRDAATGAVLAEVAEALGLATNNVAEYRGLIAGLRLAHDLNPQAQVEVRMDSRLVVEQMSGNWKIKHPDLRPLAMDAAAVLPADQVTYRWVPREQNAAADRLANVALDRVGDRLGRPPGGSPGNAAATSTVLPIARAPVAERVGTRTQAPDTSMSVESGSAVEEAPAAVSRGWAPDLGPPTMLVLLRHGETERSIEKRFSGLDDVPLTERGLSQAERAAALLARRGPISAIVSSPLARARTTADIAGDVLGVPIEVDDDLRECDFGEWEGLTFAEVMARWPDELAAWLASPEYAPPRGESFAEVGVRVRRVRDRLLERHPARTVLVVSHVTPIKQFVCLALDVDTSTVFRMELAIASLSVAAWFADGTGSLRLFNDTAHLRPAPA